MRFDDIFYSHEAYDAYYAFTKGFGTYYMMDLINKLRVLDDTLGWYRIDHICDFVKMDRQQRLDHLVGRAQENCEEFNLSGNLRDRFITSPMENIRAVHDDAMSQHRLEGWNVFCGTEKGRVFADMEKPLYAPVSASAKARKAPAAIAPPVVPAHPLQAQMAAQPAQGFHRPIVPVSQLPLNAGQAPPVPPPPSLPPVVVTAPPAVVDRARQIARFLRFRRHGLTLLGYLLRYRRSTRICVRHRCRKTVFEAHATELWQLSYRVYTGVASSSATASPVPILIR
jgi:hypothetical protein